MLLVQLYEVISPLAYTMFSEGPSSDRNRLFTQLVTLLTRSHVKAQVGARIVELSSDFACAEVTLTGSANHLLHGLAKLRRQHGKPIDPFQSLSIPPAFYAGMVHITTADLRGVTIPQLLDLPDHADSLLSILESDLRQEIPPEGKPLWKTRQNEELQLLRATLQEK